MRTRGKLLHAGTLGLLEWEPDAERVAVKRSAGNPARDWSRPAARQPATRSAGNRLQITGADVP